MSISSLSQASLAAAILASALGTYHALSPPNPTPKTSPPSAVPDTIRRLNLTAKHSTKVTLAPVGFIALYTACLAFTYPEIPTGLLGHGGENGLNASLLTWSPATAVPLALILFAGVPLRLVSYASLGRNFTFALSTPDRLNTGGIYRYVQHPSYTGIAVLVLSNMALLYRTDGTISCWIPPSWFNVVQYLMWSAAPIALGLLFFALRFRVRQEESMLRDKFGVEWEVWHAKTPRFLPWGF